MCVCVSRFIMAELIQTEKTYVRDLRECTDVSLVSLSLPPNQGVADSSHGGPSECRFLVFPRGGELLTNY